MTKPDRNPVIEAMCERYWNAYQAGITAAGLRGYPKWHESTDPVKEETRRCMRHAVEALKSLSAIDFQKAEETLRERDEPLSGKLVQDVYRDYLWPVVFDQLFADKPQRRRMKPIPNDQMQAVSAQIARMGE